MPYENIPEQIELAAVQAADKLGVTLSNIVRDNTTGAYVFTLDGHTVGLSVHIDQGRTPDELVTKLISDFRIDLAPFKTPEKTPAIVPVATEETVVEPDMVDAPIVPVVPEEASAIAPAGEFTEDTTLVEDEKPVKSGKKH